MNDNGFIYTTGTIEANSDATQLIQQLTEHVRGAYLLDIVAKIWYINEQGDTEASLSWRARYDLAATDELGNRDPNFNDHGIAGFGDTPADAIRTLKLFDIPDEWKVLLKEREGAVE